MVIFDYDGVIVDSLDYNLKITNIACQLYAPDSRPATIADLYDLSSISFDELAGKIGVKPEEIPLCLDEINRLLSIPNEQTTLFEGLTEFINDIAGQQRLAIVSHNTEVAINRVLSINSLRNYFCDVLGAESPGNKTAQILFLLEKYQVDAKKSYMIGDSVSDIVSAQQAGVNSIAVSWGFQPVERLEVAKPDLIVNNLQELKQAVVQKLH